MTRRGIVAALAACMGVAQRIFARDTGRPPTILLNMSDQDYVALSVTWKGESINIKASEIMEALKTK